MVPEIIKKHPPNYLERIPGSPGLRDKALENSKFTWQMCVPVTADKGSVCPCGLVFISRKHLGGRGIVVPVSNSYSWLQLSPEKNIVRQCSIHY